MGVCIGTRLPYHSIILLYYSILSAKAKKRRKVHGDRGSQLSVGRGKSGYTTIFMAFTEFLLKHRIPCSADY